MAGDAHRYRVTIRNSMTVFGPAETKDRSEAKPRQLTQTLTLQLSYRTVKVNPDSSTSMRITVDGARLVVSSGGIVIVDSEDPHDPLAEDLTCFLEDASFSATMLPTGALKNLRAVRNPGPGFREADLGGFLQEFQGVLPLEPVRAGDTWKSKFEWTLPPVSGLEASLESESRYRLLSIEPRRGHPCARMDIRGDYRIRRDPPASSVSSGKGKKKGTMLFDVDRGLLISSTYDADIEAKLPTTSDAGENGIVNARMKVHFSKELLE
jgi:hypothetical protein